MAVQPEEQMDDEALLQEALKLSMLSNETPEAPKTDPKN